MCFTSLLIFCLVLGVSSGRTFFFQPGLCARRDPGGIASSGPGHRSTGSASRAIPSPPRPGRACAGRGFSSSATEAFSRNCGWKSAIIRPCPTTRQPRRADADAPPPLSLGSAHHLHPARRIYARPDDRSLAAIRLDCSSFRARSRRCHRIIVYPPTVPIHRFATPIGTLSGGEAVRRRAHFVTTNAAGVRDYQPGDSFNRIHWRSSARRDRLMVKEFELDPLADVWIFLDLSQGSLVERSDQASSRSGPSCAATFNSAAFDRRIWHHDCRVTGAVFCRQRARARFCHLCDRTAKLSSRIAARASSPASWKFWRSRAANPTCTLYQMLGARSQLSRPRYNGQLSSPPRRMSVGSAKRISSRGAVFA